MQAIHSRSKRERPVTLIAPPAMPPAPAPAISPSLAVDAATVVGNPVTNPAVDAFNASVLAVQNKLSKPVTQWENNSFSESGYDAMIALALAMDAAHSTDGTVYNSFIAQVTAPGPGKKVVYTYAAGKAALAAGHKIQYVGASGPLLFNQYHNSFGAQAVEQFPANAPAQVVGTISQAEVQAIHG